MLVALNRFAVRPSLGNGVVVILALAAGLLTKAYFLAFVPLVAGLFLWRRAWRHLALAALLLCGLAGPWYARNLLRYGALSGTQEARAGIGVPAVSRSVTTVNWRGSILPDIRAGLWSGNNSSLTFSAHTLNLIIGVGAAALLLWAAGRHSAAEWITLAFCLLFILALGYATVASHIYTQGAANGPGPWYAQVLLAPVLGLMFLGTCRWGKFGRCLAALLVILFGYVLAATYVLKLIPLYGGYEGSARAGDLAQLYGREFSRLAANLDTVALAPAPIIFALALMVVGIVIAEEVLLISCLMRSAR